MKQSSRRRENRSLPNDSNPPESSAALLRELVSHLRQNRTQLREEWARRTDAELLTAMSKEEIFSEATSVYDNYGPAYLNAKAKAKRGGRLWRALAPPSSQKSKTPFNARSNRGNGGPG